MRNYDKVSEEVLPRAKLSIATRAALLLALDGWKPSRERGYPPKISIMKMRPWFGVLSLPDCLEGRCNVGLGRGDRDWGRGASLCHVRFDVSFLLFACIRTQVLPFQYIFKHHFP
jgi:hypothetical protein